MHFNLAEKASLKCMEPPQVPRLLSLSLSAPCLPPGLGPLGGCCGVQHLSRDNHLLAPNLKEAEIKLGCLSCEQRSEDLASCRIPAQLLSLLLPFARDSLISNTSSGRGGGVSPLIFNVFLTGITCLAGVPTPLSWGVRADSEGSARRRPRAR